MPTSCNCNDIVVEDCPPYLTVETFNSYTEVACSNCTAIDTATSGIDPAEYVNHFGLDSCCPVLTVYRNSQLLYSFDGGVTWIETGTAFAYATTALGSQTFTAGAIKSISITGANTTIVTNESSILSIDSNKFKVTSSGNYMIVSEFAFQYSTGTNMYMMFEAMEDTGVSLTPMRQVTTQAYQGADLSVFSTQRYMNLTMLRRLGTGAADGSWNYRTFTGITTFTGIATINTRVIKLSS
jgi:hypothetical protein